MKTENDNKCEIPEGKVEAIFPAQAEIPEHLLKQ